MLAILFLVDYNLLLEFLRTRLRTLMMSVLVFNLNFVERDFVMFLTVPYLHPHHIQNVALMLLLLGQALLALTRLVAAPTLLVHIPAKLFIGQVNVPMPTVIRLIVSRVLFMTHLTINAVMFILVLLWIAPSLDHLHSLNCLQLVLFRFPLQASILVLGLLQAVEFHNHVVFVN